MQSNIVTKCNMVFYCLLKDVPRNVSFLSQSPNKVLEPCEIRLCFEKKHFHAQIEDNLPKKYYEDYLMTASYSPKMQEHQAAQATRLSELTEGKAKSFVEIGCGDGSFIKHVQKHIPHCVGIEPSRRFATEAKCDGVNVLVGYVGCGDPLTEETFDAFASRQVFEHLPNPLEVLKTITRMLNEDAIGLIEVPNGYRALRKGRYFEFFPDHVNYFSVNSLVELASNAGLNVVSCHESFGGDYLELWVRNNLSPENYFEEMVVTRRESIAALGRKIVALVEEEKSIAVWGAGAKLLSIISSLDAQATESISFVIDSDPHKHGRYIPNTKLRVVSPNDAAIKSVDIFVILALSYTDEVSAMIRKNYPWYKDILYMNETGQIESL